MLSTYFSEQLTIDLVELENRGSTRITAALIDKEIPETLMKIDRRHFVDFNTRTYLANQSNQHLIEYFYRHNQN